MEPFALSQKLEDLNVVLHEAVQKYPKSERFGIAKETAMCGVRAAAMVARGNQIKAPQEKARKDVQAIQRREDPSGARQGLTDVIPGAL